jgi:hypothetical protein
MLPDKAALALPLLAQLQQDQALDMLDKIIGIYQGKM